MRTLIFLFAGICLNLLTTSAEAGYPPYSIRYPGQSCRQAGESSCFGRYRNWKFQIPAERQNDYYNCVKSVPVRCVEAGMSGD